MRKCFTIIAIVCLQATAVRSIDILYEGVPPRNAKSVERFARHAASVSPDSVEAILRSDAYLDAEVRLDEDQLIIAAGQLYTIDSVYVKGDTNLILQIDRACDRGNIEKLTDSILNCYYDRGHYWSSVRVDQVRKYDGHVQLTLRLIKGPAVTVEKKAYSGLVRTRPDLVARYIPVQAGDTLTEMTVHRAEQGAAGIPFVTFHPPAQIKPSHGFTSANLEFLFSEPRQFGLEMGGGYLPDDPAGLVWHFSLNFNNLFGQGKDASFLSERRESGRNLLRVKYAQPLFWTGVGNLQFQVATRDYREQFYEFQLEGTYTSRLNGDISGGFSLGWKSVRPSINVPDYSRFSAEFAVEQLALDNKVNPTNGLSLNWSIGYAHRRYAEDSLAVIPERLTFNETRTAFSLGLYKKVVGIVVGHLGLNYVGLETSETLPPLAELTFIGGPGSLRGYRNEQFSAIRAAYGTVEPRLRFAGGNLFVFYDAAYLNNRIANASHNGASVRTEEKYRYGYGFGVALHDAQRSLELSLAWNPEITIDQPRLSIEFTSDL